MTDLKDKAIDIKGKKYVLVSDRILAFNEMYPEGSITTELLSGPNDEMVVMKATVLIGNRVFTGHSQAKWGDGYINKTSALENCETSAVGRCLAMMGIGVLDSIASVDEIIKANNSDPIMDATEYANKERKVLDGLNPDTGHKCPLHNVPMTHRFSEKKQTWYWAHENAGQLCFGGNHAN